jgi:hypothetical protein
MRLWKSMMRRWKSTVTGGVFAVFMEFAGWHALTWRFWVACAIFSVYGMVSASEREASLKDNGAAGPLCTLWKSN